MSTPTGYGVAATATQTPPSVEVQVPKGGEVPVKAIRAEDLKNLGQKFNSLFMQYRADRRIAELRWLRNLRQYLGVYDPEIEKELAPNRSRAYPRITRVKCVSILSRIMNLMFQGTEQNWQIKGDPIPSLTQADVEEAISDAQQEAQQAGEQFDLTLDTAMQAIKKLGDKRAAALTNVIADQLEELGGDQTCDYVALTRAVLKSGIIYGVGVLTGPYARAVNEADISIDPITKAVTVKDSTSYKPMYEFRSVWEFYPDMSAKTLRGMDGYFFRTIMARKQLYDLSKRSDFLGDEIKKYLRDHPRGNFQEHEFEMDLRVMGLKINVNTQKPETNKYEVITWHGPVSGHLLSQCGVDVPDDKLGDEITAEIWMVDGNIIKVDMNAWAKLGVDVDMIHTFLFDEDDTSPVGMGMPNIMRDSQMAISAATRMVLDNASVICGPNLELNTDLLRLDQDLTSTSAYKMWYREGTGPEAQFPAVRNVQIDGHLDELLKIIELYMKFVDQETFVGPATGGDMEQAPSEPMRTAAGASMLRGDAALPFKDIIRSFDSFTQSVIQSLIFFNRMLNPTKAPMMEFNVIARGATSLIAKEVRGMQVDQIAATLTPDEKVFVDMQKLVKERFLTRDMTDMLKPDDQVQRDIAQQAQQTAAQQALADALSKANERKLLSDAYKNITQGNKNSAATDANMVDTALSLLEQGVGDAQHIARSVGGGGVGPSPQEPGQSAASGLDGGPQLPTGQDQGSAGLGLPG